MTMIHLVEVHLTDGHTVDVLEEVQDVQVGLEEAQAEVHQALPQQRKHLRLTSVVH